MKKLIKFVTFKKREQSKWELTYILREEFLFLFEKKKKNCIEMMVSMKKKKFGLYWACALELLF